MFCTMLVKKSACAMEYHWGKETSEIRVLNKKCRAVVRAVLSEK